MIFSTEEVWALLEKRKTRTMRVMKCCSPGRLKDFGGNFKPKETSIENVNVNGYSGYSIACNGCLEWGCDMRPCHKVGDIVYVREMWAEDRCEECEGAPAALRGLCTVGPCLRGYVYRADGEKPEGWAHAPRWRPSIHMPSDAARIFLRITGVKAQKPQELTAEEIRAEGIFVPACTVMADGCGHCQSYSVLGCMRKERTHKKWAKLWNFVRPKKTLPLYGYEANPLCWVYEFELLEVDS
jgi:hypothetical protein